MLNKTPSLSQLTFPILPLVPSEAVTTKGDEVEDQSVKEVSSLLGTYF